MKQTLLRAARLRLGAVLAILLTLSLACAGLGGTPITHTLTFAADTTTTVTPEMLAVAQAVLQKRLSAQLEGKAEVQIVNDALQVTLIYEVDIAPAIQAASEVGEIIFFDSTEPYEVGETAPDDVPIILTNEDVAEAAVARNPNTGAQDITLTFTSTGGEKMRAYTTNNLGHYLVIARDGVVLYAPTINGVIENYASISGTFTLDEANVIAAQLMSGRLPFPLVLVEQK